MTSRMALRYPLYRKSLIKLVVLGVIIAVFVVPICYLRCDRNKRIPISDSKYSIELRIKPDGLNMPLGRILLVKKESSYCGIKLAKAWTGDNTEELWTEYEINTRVDSTGKFVGRTDVEELHMPLLMGCGHYSCSFGDEYYIDCGFVELRWWGPNWLCAGETASPDPSIEMAPTPWTEISQVNVHDPRVKWIRFDGRQIKTKMNIDDLWIE